MCFFGFWSKLSLKYQKLRFGDPKPMSLDPVFGIQYDIFYDLESR